VRKGTRDACFVLAYEDDEGRGMTRGTQFTRDAGDTPTDPAAGASEATDPGARDPWAAFDLRA